MYGDFERKAHICHCLKPQTIMQEERERVGGRGEEILPLLFILWMVQ